ncbi:MAG: PcfK-like family protein [Prevotella melaninogenica]|nr:PcfK-like family protein [Prevotella melaninogenica]
MKGTEHFTRTIAEYLNQRAMTDPLFAPNLMKPNKNIEECITYILNEVQKSGCNGFDDDDELLRAWLEKIFSMAVHYYDEDDIEVGKAISCQVAVNHIVELTEEEKAEARQEAIKQYQREELAKLQSRNARVKKTENAATQVQPSLFDF